MLLSVLFLRLPAMEHELADDRPEQPLPAEGQPVILL
jgi:hypothetical protein